MFMDKEKEEPQRRTEPGVMAYVYNPGLGGTRRRIKASLHRSLKSDWALWDTVSKK